MIARLLVVFQLNKHHLIFILSVFLSLILIYNSSSNNLSQFRLKVDHVVSYVKSPITKIRLLAKTEQENKILKEKLMVLSLENETLHINKFENIQLKEMLDFSRNSTVKMIPTKVLNMGLTPNLLSMTIDIGDEAGININDPIITTSGIVGKVATINDNTSLVQLISDPKFRIGVRFIPSGATGILRWRSNNNCEVREVYKNSMINVGDRVVSSGLSDIFPADLPIGIVTGVTDDRSQFQKTVSVHIANNLSALSNVFVIVSEEIQ